MNSSPDLKIPITKIASVVKEELLAKEHKDITVGKLRELIKAKVTAVFDEPELGTDKRAYQYDYYKIERYVILSLVIPFVIKKITSISVHTVVKPNQPLNENDEAIDKHVKGSLNDFFDEELTDIKVLPLKTMMQLLEINIAEIFDKAMLEAPKDRLPQAQDLLERGMGTAKFIVLNLGNIGALLLEASNEFEHSTENLTSVIESIYPLAKSLAQFPLSSIVNFQQYLGKHLDSINFIRASFELVKDANGKPRLKIKNGFFSRAKADWLIVTGDVSTTTMGCPAGYKVPTRDQKEPEIQVAIKQYFDWLVPYMLQR